MFIVLEGPDGVGKTTYAQKLLTNYAANGYTVMSVKRGPLKEDPMTEYVKPLHDLAASNDIVIMDRWHIGEFVYGPILRDRSQLSEWQINYIDMVLATYGAAFVYITRKLDDLAKIVTSRGDDLITAQLIGEVWLGYAEFMPQLPHWVRLEPHELPVSITDYNGQSPYAGPYIGPRKPRVLLLGDVRGHDEFIHPFVPRPATSGNWLMKAMSAADVPYMDVGIVNACDKTPAFLEHIWSILGSPPIVALGANAYKHWMTTERTEHAVVHQLPHPQYMRRFRNKEYKSYGELIKSAMKE